MKPLFDFYLRTTKMLEIAIKQTGFYQYAVRSANLPIPLDIDMLTATGIQEITLSGTGAKIISNYRPVVDPKGYDLKTVTSD